MTKCPFLAVETVPPCGPNSAKSGGYMKLGGYGREVGSDEG